MTYHCTDCSYRGKTSGAAGECPACGSYNLVRDGSGKQETPPPARWRMVLLVALWSYLIFLIILKLVP